MRRKLCQDEVKLIDTLIANGESDGVIGIENEVNPKTPK